MYVYIYFLYTYVAHVQTYISSSSCETAERYVEKCMRAYVYLHTYIAHIQTFKHVHHAAVVKPLKEMCVRVATSIYIPIHLNILVLVRMRLEGQTCFECVRVHVWYWIRKNWLFRLWDFENLGLTAGILIGLVAIENSYSYCMRKIPSLFLLLV